MLSLMLVSVQESIFHSFFVIYRLGFLSDLEHRVWNSQDEAERPGRWSNVKHIVWTRMELETLRTQRWKSIPTHSMVCIYIYIYICMYNMLAPRYKPFPSLITCDYSARILPGTWPLPGAYFKPTLSGWFWSKIRPFKRTAMKSE